MPTPTPVPLPLPLPLPLPPTGTEAAVDEIIRFGVFEIDRFAGELRKRGSKVRIQEKPFQALLLLVDRPGKLINRDEFRQVLWPDDQFGDFEHGLNLAVNRLRAVLGDKADSPRFVETVPRRGYRFIAPVENPGARAAVASAAEAAAPVTEAVVPVAGTVASTAVPAAVKPSAAEPIVARASLPRPAWDRGLGMFALCLLVLLVSLTFKRFQPQHEEPSQRPVLLVLPFRDLSPEAAEYLGEGLTIETIGRLGQLAPERLGVIAFTTAARFRREGEDLEKIARDLGVDYVLETSLTRSGDQVRVHSQLIRAEDQTLLLSEAFNSEVSDLLALQSQVAERVTATLGEEILDLGTLERQDTSVSPDAYQAYLRGRFLWNQRTPESLERAVQSFEQALVLEPDWAPALVGLAEAYSLFSSYGIAKPDEALPKAREAALRALEIDPDLAEAHTVLAWVRWTYEWKFDEADQSFRQATRLNANHATAYQWHAGLLVSMAHFDEAAEEMRRALDLDPLSLIINTGTALMSYYARRYDQAMENSRRTLELQPAFGYAWELMAQTLAQQGRHEEAKAWLEKRLETENTPAIRADLAYVLARSGDRQGARALLDGFTTMELDAYVPPYRVALIHVALGDKDQAFHWLEVAYSGRAFEMVLAAVDPRLDPLRDDPRYEDLRGRIGL